MRRALILSCLLTLVACDDADEAACADLAARATATVAESPGCAEDRDCVVVGGPTTCNCAASYGPWAVTRAARDALDAIGRDELARGCHSAICDAAPYESAGPPTCVDGRCRLPPAPSGCLPLPYEEEDVGASDAAPDVTPGG